jgi:phage tail sheath gpL-like
MISFNSIPVGILTPGAFIEFDNSRAVRGLPALAHRILVIGQKRGAGTAPPLTAKRAISAAQAETDYGRGSMLANMVAAVKAANRYTDCYAIALVDNPAGNIAAGILSVSGAPMVGGTINLYLGGVRVQVGVSAGQTQQQVAAAIAAAINANTQLMVSATANSANVELAFLHAGETGNDYDVRCNYGFGEVFPAGVSVVVTAPMSGGSGNPSLSALIAAIGDDQYDTIILPYTDSSSLNAMDAEMLRRWGPMVMREGHVFAAVNGTVGDATTLGDSRNGPFTTIMHAGRSPTPPWIFAAVTGAVDAFESDPARPRQTLPLTGCLAPAEADRPTREERNTMLGEGIATYTVDAAGLVRIERLVTTYQESPSGDPDISYLDIETPRTLAYMRATMRLRITSRFPRHKLANDGTAYDPGQAIVTPMEIRAELLHLAREWEAAGLLEDFAAYSADLVVERNATDRNRVDVLAPPNLVNQFRVLAAVIQFVL